MLNLERISTGLEISKTSITSSLLSSAAIAALSSASFAASFSDRVNFLLWPFGSFLSSSKSFLS